MNRLFLLCFLLLLPCITWGQSLRYGFSMGINSADHPTLHRLTTTEDRRGVNAGIRLQYALTPAIHLHSLIAYSQKGSIMGLVLDTSAQHLGNSADFKLKLNYIDFPVLISRSIRLVEGVRIHPMAGIDQGILLSAFEEVPQLSSNNEIQIRRANLLTNDQVLLNRYVFGLTGGISSQFDVYKKLILFLDIRYAHSLNYAISNIRNSCITVNTGLLF